MLTGMATGAAAAILLAPRSGSETRDYLRRKADESADYIKDRTNQMIKDTAAMIHQARKMRARIYKFAKSVAAVCR